MNLTAYIANMQKVSQALGVPFADLVNARKKAASYLDLPPFDPEAAASCQRCQKRNHYSKFYSFNPNPAYQEAGQAIWVDVDAAFALAHSRNRLPFFNLGSDEGLLQVVKAHELNLQHVYHVPLVFGEPGLCVSFEFTHPDGTRQIEQTMPDANHRTAKSLVTFGACVYHLLDVEETKLVSSTDPAELLLRL